jgi:hypothetical protein
MEYKELIAQVPGFQDYAQEVQQRFEMQEQVLSSMAKMNAELIGLIQSVVKTQGQQSQAIQEQSTALAALRPTGPSA